MPLAEPPSVVVLAAPSGDVAPLWDVVRLLCPHHQRQVVLAAEPPEGGAQGWTPEAAGHLYLYDASLGANRYLAAAPVTLILGFRDPRDASCEQFYAAQNSHGAAGDEFAARRARIIEQGIDQYVLGLDLTPAYRPLTLLEERSASEPSRTMAVSQAQLVLDFEGMVRRLASVLALPEAEIPWDALEGLRPAASPGQAGGAIPGRYHTELQPATIAALDERYAELLAFLRQREQPRLRHLLATEGLRRQMRGVLVGQEDELFLTSDANDVIGQVTGRKPMPRTELFRIAAAHRMRRVFGATVGNFRYEHMIIPNKECALQRLLPPEIEFESAGPRPVAQYLASPAARVWRPFYESELLSPNGDNRYFSRTDTHWNHAGALRYLSAFLGAQVPHLCPALEELALRRFAGTQTGDLGSKLEMEAETIEIIAPMQPRARMVFTNDITNEGCVRWYRATGAPTRERVFILHDSFTLWLLDLLPELCAEALFFHGTVFDYEVMERFNPSLVFCFQVERFFNRVPDTGGNLLAFIDAEEKRKGTSRPFAEFWANFLRTAR